MRYYELITEGAVPVISPQQAVDGKMFGPMYHGTPFDLADIIKHGFDTKKSIPTGLGYLGRPSGTSHGYPLEAYSQGICAPIHHLGFGNYFTTVKAIAKQYSGGTTRGQRTFYLDSNNVEVINFGSPNTMMKWWQKNGYDMTAKETVDKNFDAWVRATNNLTLNLSSQFDAVHFLGKGIRKLLDGDQVCVYKPELVRVVDPKLASGLEIGAKVTHTQAYPQRFRGRNEFYLDDVKADDWKPRVGWKGVFRGDLDDRESKSVAQHGRYPVHHIPPADMVGVITNVRYNAHTGTKMYDVKWKNGGIQHNYTEDELSPKQ